MTKNEAMRITRQENVLMSIGFTQKESEKLRRISMTLHRWHELECGTDGGCVERDETTNKTYWHNSYSGRRTPIADRETGALKRLSAVMRAHRDRQTPTWPDGKAVYPNTLRTYIQTDPRGAALYIIRPGDIPEGGDVGAYYDRGICVY
jgi:hypothetical protein